MHILTLLPLLLLLGLSWLLRQHFLKFLSSLSCPLVSDAIFAVCSRSCLFRVLWFNPFTLAILYVMRPKCCLLFQKVNLYRLPLYQSLRLLHHSLVFPSISCQPLFPVFEYWSIFHSAFKLHIFSLFSQTVFENMHLHLFQATWLLLILFYNYE